MKSLVVRRHTPEGTPVEYPFALIPGDRQISWAKLPAVVGVRALSLPSPELALEAIGWESSTITPLGSTVAWPVFADASMVGGRITMGAGEAGYGAFVEADDLIAAYGATVPISASKPGTNELTRRDADRPISRMAGSRGSLISL